MAETKEMAVTPFDATRAWMLQARGQLAQVLPKSLTPDRLVRVALNACIRNPTLLKADKTSFLKALSNCAEIGLEPDGLWGMAYLIPFKNNKMGITEVQVVVGYKGLADLARRTGEIASIRAEVVREGERFEVEQGLTPILIHVPNLARDLKAKVTHAYAVVSFRGGEQQFDWMTRDEIERVRARSRAANSGPWVTDWAEMAKKTVFRRLAKWLPVSWEYRQAQEFDADTIEVEAGPSASKVQEIEGLKGTFLEPQGGPQDSSEDQEVKEGTAADLTALLIDLPDEVADGIMAEIECKTIAEITPDQIARGLELAYRAAAKLPGRA